MQSSLANNVQITLHLSSITVQILLCQTHCLQVLGRRAFHISKQVYDVASEVTQ